MSENKRTQQVDFKLVKATVSILQILDHYKLTDTFIRSSNGENMTGPCPLHGGDNPTQFRISLTKNIWNCFGKCQGGGNILTFVAKKEDQTIRKAALLIAEWFDLPAPSKAKAKTPASQQKSVAKPEFRPEPEPEAKSFLSPASSPPAEVFFAGNKPLGFELKHLDAAHPYLTERGLTPETIATFGLGFCAKGSMTGRIAIPIHDDLAQLVGYAGRWPGSPPEGTSKYKFPAEFKKSHVLFNLHRAILLAYDQPLVIVEGFFDVIKLWQNGIQHAVAIMGCSLSPAQETLLLNVTDSQSKILLMMDEDDAGRAAAEQIEERLTPHRFVKTYHFPKEGMQPEHLIVADMPDIFGWKE